MTDRDAIKSYLRECWVLRRNLRLSRTDGPWPEPCWRACVLESVTVSESMRRRGVFKRFLAELCALPGYDLFIVEMVGNPVLADALTRWGWMSDRGVSDFYHFPGISPDPVGRDVSKTKTRAAPYRSEVMPVVADRRY